MEQAVSNPLGTEDVKKLLRQFAPPSIIAMLVGTLYNIVDQFFIGQTIGELGNAATNVVFPLVPLCISMALMFGIGGASAFNISLGQKDKETATYYMGNAITTMFIIGISLTVLTEIFLNPLLVVFGSPAEVMDYARTYTRITALGFPFLIFSSGGGNLIRADGRPKVIMGCNITGAVINTVLDYIFVFRLQYGMAGAAYATIIGQYISGGLTVYFLTKCRTTKLSKRHFVPKWKYIKRIASLGTAPCINQLSMMFTQIIMNNSLKYYGGMSVYGEAIPIACVGIVSKVNQFVMSFYIGFAQSLQPIASFNRGAGNHKRVKEAYIATIKCALVVGVIALACFQLFPRQIIGIFGDGSDEYFAFATMYLKIFLAAVALNAIQPVTSNFFTAIGMPKNGIFLSLTRQVIFLVPLILVLPLIMGIDGIMYAGLCSDILAFATAVILVVREFKKKEYKISEK